MPLAPEIQDLIRQLAIAGVTELALASGRLPCIKDTSGVYVPIAQRAIDEDTLLAALVESGGGAAVMTLADKPASWKTRVAGLGVVTAVAVRRGTVLQARFVLTTREAARPISAVAEEEMEIAPPSSGMLDQNAGARPGELELELDVGTVAPARQPHEPARHQPQPQPQPPPQPAPVASPSPRPRASQIDVEVEPQPTAPVPRELTQILASARSKAATDVHVVAERATSFRIGGALVPQSGFVTAEEAASMLETIVPARLAATLKKSGSCDFALIHPELGRFRVNVARQRTGLKGCFRLVSREVPQITQLGLPTTILDATHHHQGLVLITGPTGSGKSTTLAALVDALNRDTTHHIVTIEDPIEHLHTKKKALLSQREVGTHTRSFEAALKGALREDPDVIVVGELRDAETVRMALTASETGHLVLATMNTPSAAKTIERLIDLFPPGDQGQVRMTLAGGLRLIVGQRLVPALQGGMIAAAEMLPGCIPLWSLIRDNRTFQIPSLQQRGKQLGIIRLDEQLLEHVRAGRVAMEAARFLSEAPELFGK